jgi:hypothetical protein
VKPLGWCFLSYRCGGIGVETVVSEGVERCRACAGGEWPEPSCNVEEP